MPPILTADDVVKRIAAECTFVDERGAVGIRLEPAAAIVRRYGDQFRVRRRKPVRRPPNHSPCHDREWRFSIIYFANRNPLTERASASLLKVLTSAPCHTRSRHSVASTLRDGR